MSKYFLFYTTDSYLPFDIITGEDVTKGELTKDNEAQEFISETS